MTMSVEAGIAARGTVGPAAAGVPWWTNDPEHPDGDVPRIRRDLTSGTWMLGAIPLALGIIGGVMYLGISRELAVGTQFAMSSGAIAVGFGTIYGAAQLGQANPMRTTDYAVATGFESREEALAWARTQNGWTETTGPRESQRWDIQLRWPSRPMNVALDEYGDPDAPKWAFVDHTLPGAGGTYSQQRPQTPQRPQASQRSQRPGSPQVPSGVPTDPHGPGTVQRYWDPATGKDVLYEVPPGGSVVAEWDPETGTNRNYVVPAGGDVVSEWDPADRKQRNYVVPDGGDVVTTWDPQAQQQANYVVPAGSHVEQRWDPATGTMRNFVVAD